MVYLMPISPAAASCQILVQTATGRISRPLTAMRTRPTMAAGSRRATMRRRWLTPILRCPTISLPIPAAALSARANEKEGSTSAVVQPMVRLKDPARHATHLWRLAAYWQHDPDYCIARFSPRYLQRAAGHEWEYVANGRGLGADHHFYRHYRKLYACPNGRWDIGLPSANIRYLERNRYLSGSRLDHWG